MVSLSTLSNITFFIKEILIVSFDKFHFWNFGNKTEIIALKEGKAVWEENIAGINCQERSLATFSNFRSLETFFTLFIPATFYSYHDI